MRCRNFIYVQGTAVIVIDHGVQKVMILCRFFFILSPMTGNKGIGSGSIDGGGCNVFALLCHGSHGIRDIADQLFCGGILFRTEEKTGHSAGIHKVFHWLVNIIKVEIIYVRGKGTGKIFFESIVDIRILVCKMGSDLISGHSQTKSKYQ